MKIQRWPRIEGQYRAMADAALGDFIRTYDLYDKGVDAITRDEAGRVRFVFELFHVDDPHRNDEARQYRLTAIFRPEDVALHEGVLWHDERDWLGTVLEFAATADTLRVGIEWRNIANQDYSWTSLLLCGGPIQVEEIVSDC